MEIIAWVLAAALLGGILAGIGMAWRYRATLRNLEKEKDVLEALRAEQMTRLEALSRERDELRAALTQEQSARIRAETQRDETLRRLEEEKRLLDEARERMTDAFKALASDTLHRNTEEFLSLARAAFERSLADVRGEWGQRHEAIQGLVRPLAESLGRFEEQVRSLEKSREGAYAGLLEQLRALSEAQQRLQKETGNLVNALRKPQVRGRWGELTLRRVVELAGLSAHCDFTEQVNVSTDEGGRMRPDLIVHLPGGRDIIVDAKAPLDAYLDTLAAEDEESRRQALERHIRQIRAHIARLGSKEYWTLLPSTPEFVVLFIPGEAFFAAAADQDLTLIEDALAQKVILATPTTLMALLRAIAFGWRQEQISRNAHQIFENARILHERLTKFTADLARVGSSLNTANKAFNEAVGSLERRVLPSARKIGELSVGGDREIPEVPPVDLVPRLVASEPGAEKES